MESISKPVKAFAFAIDAIRRRQRLVSALVAVLTATCGPSALADTSQYQLLYTFQGPPSDSASPADALTLGADGNLYGVSPEGGANQTGSIFQVLPSGAEKVIYNFSYDGQQDGYYPYTRLIADSDGGLIGGNNAGIVFKVMPDGSFTKLFAMNQSTQGYNISALIKATDGTLYGTTVSGGTYGVGTVFSISPTGTYKLLHAFNPSVEGTSPIGPIAQTSDGRIWGTTSAGGPDGHGEIFWVTGTRQYKVVHEFQFTETNFGGTGLTLGPDGSLYGSLPGGAYFDGGSLFKVTPKGLYSLIHYMDFYEYEFPDASFTSEGKPGPLTVGADGNLYGVAGAGGYQLSDGITFGGTIFRINSKGQFSTVYNFASPDPGLDETGNVSLGYTSPSVIEGQDGALYGITVGTNGNTGLSQAPYGSVFRIAPTQTPSIVNSFSVGTPSYTCYPKQGYCSWNATVKWSSGNTTACNIMQDMPGNPDFYYVAQQLGSSGSKVLQIINAAYAPPISGTPYTINMMLACSGSNGTESSKYFQLNWTIP